MIRPNQRSLVLLGYKHIVKVEELIKKRYLGFYGRALVSMDMSVLEGLAKNECLRLFDGDLEEGWLLPATNHDALICGHFRMLGRIILHSILLEGPGFPFFPPPVYYYLVNGTIESAMPHMDIKYLPLRQKTVVEQVIW